MHRKIQSWRALVHHRCLIWLYRSRRVGSRSTIGNSGNCTIRSAMNREHNLVNAWGILSPFSPAQHFKCSIPFLKLFNTFKYVIKMSNKPDEIIKKYFDVLSQESKELYLTDYVSELENSSISPLSFYRDYVSKNLPLIIRGGVKHWPAIGKWGIPYFRQMLSNKMISVAVTPNGYADAIAVKKSKDGNECLEYFVMPEERLVPMSQFLDEMETPGVENVHYIQKQNSNFKEDFPELWPDAGIDIPWANEAFGKTPDAVNIWMGDRRAVTSMHKDPYENIYCVVSGEKEFLLHPPTDLPWIPYNNYPTASYREVKPGQWDIEPIVIERTEETEIVEDGSNCSMDSDLLPWISVDPLNPDYNRYPQYRNAKTLRVTVRAGDMLYLPSLWFHYVRQTHACIALNYWYDMEYDIKYAYYKALEVLCR